jgi:hypothetical protein
MLKIMDKGIIPFVFTENKICDFTEVSSNGYFRNLAVQLLKTEKENKNRDLFPTTDPKVNLVDRPPKESLSKTINQLYLSKKPFIFERVIIVCGGLGATESLKEIVQRNEIEENASVIVIQQSNANGIIPIISMLRKATLSDVISLSHETKLRENRTYVYHPGYKTKISDYGVFLPQVNSDQGSKYLSLKESLDSILSTTRKIKFDLVVLSGLETDIIDSIQKHRDKIRTVVVEEKPVVGTMINALLARTKNVTRLLPSKICDYLTRKKNKGNRDPISITKFQQEQI